jgi:ribosomal protein S18 acetylase RimI-like enzyme
MEDNIRIQKATKFDTNQILNLFRESENLTGSKEDNYYISDILDYIKRGGLFIAKEKTKVVGAINCEIHTDYIYLQVLVVTRDYQKKGIGTKLIEFLESFAKKRNTIQIEMFVEENNNRMQKFISKKSYKRGKKFVYYTKFLKN